MKALSLILFGLVVLSTTFARADEAASPEEAAQAANTNLVLAPDLKLASPTGRSLQPSLSSSITSCNDSSKLAHTFCLSSNPKLQTASGMIGVLLSGASALKSANDSCQKYNEALKIGEAALTAYNGMCGAAMINCENSCGGTIKEMDAGVTSLSASSTTDMGASQIDINVIRTSRTYIMKQLATCQKYKMNLAAAGLGLMNIIKQSSVAKNCENATSTTAATTVTDCSKAEYSNTSECICQRTPTAAGCAGYTGSNSLAAGGQTANNGISADKASSFSGSSGSDSTIAGPRGSSGGGSSGGSSGGNSFGSGGNGGGLDSGANAGKSADGKKDQKGLNANILSGFEGGGGGGASSRGGGRPDSSYNAYLPGGSKDPSRGLASKNGVDPSLTGSGAKTLWEKVNDRYQESKSSLKGP